MDCTEDTKPTFFQYKLQDKLFQDLFASFVANSGCTDDNYSRRVKYSARPLPTGDGIMLVREGYDRIASDGSFCLGKPKHVLFTATVGGVAQMVSAEAYGITPGTMRADCEVFVIRKDPTTKMYM